MTLSDLFLFASASVGMTLIVVYGGIFAQIVDSSINLRFCYIHGCDGGIRIDANMLVTVGDGVIENSTSHGIVAFGWDSGMAASIVCQ